MNTVWEYLSARFDYRGRGITQAFNLLDVNGQRLTGWTSESKQTAKTLPELRLAGEDGWEMLSHSLNQDVQANGVTRHYTQFAHAVQASKNTLTGFCGRLRA